MTAGDAKAELKNKNIIHICSDKATMIIDALTIDYTMDSDEVTNGMNRSRLYSLWIEGLLGV